MNLGRIRMWTCATRDESAACGVRHRSLESACRCSVRHEADGAVWTPIPLDGREWLAPGEAQHIREMMERMVLV